MSTISLSQQRKNTEDSDKYLAVTKVLRGGNLVVLEDGSEWEVFFLNAVRSINWVPAETRVVIREDGGYPFPYNAILDKENSRDQVNARRVG